MRQLKNCMHSNSKGGKAFVMGLGRSAMACATHLIDEGWDLEMGDVRAQPQQENCVRSALPGVSIYTPVESYMLAGKDLVVLSCTSAPSNLRIADMAAEHGVPVMNSLELFFACAGKPIISVTGTNGKSSVTTLVRNIIEKHRATVQQGGCRGYTFMELLGKQPTDAYLLELSAPHLEQVTHIRSDVAAILNVSPDHRERYASIDSYVETMSKLVYDAGMAVINRDDPITAQIAMTGPRITFGLQPPETENDYGIEKFSGIRWIVRGATKLINADRCTLTGDHNLLNMLASCAIAEAAGYPVKPVRTVVVKFAGLPYRCSTEGEWNGVRWVNDARSANVGAALAAIRSNSRPVVLIAGGLSRGADFSPIPKLVNGRLRGCVFFGRDRREISKSFNGSVTQHYAEDIYEAINVANRMTRAGDCVVFSPGCSSNDQFTDYEHRGKTFSQALQLQVL